MMRLKRTTKNLLMKTIVVFSIGCLYLEVNIAAGWSFPELHRDRSSSSRRSRRRTPTFSQHEQQQQQQQQQPKPRIKQIQQKFVAMSILSSCMFTTTIPFIDNNNYNMIAHASMNTMAQSIETTKSNLDQQYPILATTNTNLGENGKIELGGVDIDIDTLRQSLALPTDDKPQITLPPNTMNSYKPSISTSNPSSAITTPVTKPKSSSIIGSGTKTNNIKSPIMEGILYLRNNNIRPELNDNIVITISTTSNPNIVLAGAKYNVYKAKFPFNFRLYDENVVKGREDDWKDIQNNIDSNSSSSNNGGDFIVTARICPEEITKLPCSDEESLFMARSVSKLLRIDMLPGANEGDIVRTAVSLPLEQINYN